MNSEPSGSIIMLFTYVFQLDKIVMLFSMLRNRYSCHIIEGQTLYRLMQMITVVYRLIRMIG